MDKKSYIKHLSQIESYINGTLTVEEIDDLWTEFLKNPELHDYFITELHLQSLRRKGASSAGVYRTDEDRVTEGQRSYNVWKYAAAAIILLVASLQFFRVSDQPEQGLSALSLSAIDHSEMAGSDIYRSGGQPAPEANIVINEGLAYAYENDTALAIQTFRDLLDRELSPEQQARVELNLGILLYNDGKYQEASTRFLTVTRIDEAQEAITEKGWWFLGNSLLQTGDVAGAGEAISYTEKLNGRFQNDATRLLDNLESEER